MTEKVYRYTEQELRALSKAILKELGVVTPPVPVQEIIETADIGLEFGSFHDTEHRKKLAAHTLLVDGYRVIRVNGELPREEQRYAMAREFGRYRLYTRPDLILGRSYRSAAKGIAVERRPQEREISYFADYLVAPDYLLKDYLRWMFTVPEPVFTRRFNK
jgi:hypothetical protein